MTEITKVGEQQVALSGACNVEDCISLRRELEILVRRASGSQFNICFEALETVSSAILSLMLCLVRIAQTVDCDLSFSGLSQRLYDMARVGGLESMLPMAPR